MAGDASDCMKKISTALPIALFRTCIRIFLRFLKLEKMREGFDYFDTPFT